MMSAERSQLNAAFRALSEPNHIKLIFAFNENISTTARRVLFDLLENCFAGK